MDELTPTSLSPDAASVLETMSEPAAPAQPVQLASFKRRAAAAITDLTLLAIGLFLLGLILGNLAFRLGIWGRLVGMAIIGLYLGWGNSERMHGQTLGKRITKIAVVDKKGEFLPLGRSLTRSFMLASLLLLIKGGVPFLNWRLLLDVLAIVGTGLMLTMTYAYIFNRTRQGIHDVVAKSYVVQYPVQGIEFPRPRPNFWQEAFVVAVAGILLSAICGRSIFGIDTGSTNINWAELTKVQTLLLEKEYVNTVTVQQLFVSRNGEPTESWLKITVWSAELCRKQQDLERCRAKIQEYGDVVLANYNGLDELDGLQVAIENQFDFLIMNGKWTVGDQGPISYWQERGSVTGP